VIEDSTRYGSKASGGSVLSMASNSEIYGEVEVIESANYTIALRAKPCEICKLTLIVDREDDKGDVIEPGITMSSISLNDSGNSSPGLKWVYLNNTYLSKGNYGIRIHSNSETDLDLVAIYSEDSSYQATPSDDVSPAYLTNYKKINPTKYTLEIRNATRPYVLSLAESYDPLWVAYATNIHDPASKGINNNYEFKTNSVPLYSIINGFPINKTGSYNLTIEYEPQAWFFTGGAISAVVVILILMLVIVSYLIRRTTIFGYLKRRFRRRLLEK
jgi:hypothetical protein